MDKDWHGQVAERFDKKSEDYEDAATIQRRIAARLSSFLPEKNIHSVLEIGCGTGFLTKHLATMYPEAKIDVTDISIGMIKQCKKKFRDHPNINFFRFNAEKNVLEKEYDLIVSSMALQWLSNPNMALEKFKKSLTPHGVIYFSTLGEKNFWQWKDVLKRYFLQDGTLEIHGYNGIFKTEFLEEIYNDGHDFLSQLKSIGANQPREGYSPLSSVQLKKAMHYLSEDFENHITWHIVYGKTARAD